MANRRRLRDWQNARAKTSQHRRLLDKPNMAGVIDWSRASVDPLSVSAKGGPKQPARIPSIAQSPEASVTFSSVATESRSLSYRPAPSFTLAQRPNPRSMSSYLSAKVADTQAAGRIGCLSKEISLSALPQRNSSARRHRTHRQA